MLFDVNIVHIHGFKPSNYVNETELIIICRCFRSIKRDET